MPLWFNSPANSTSKWAANADVELQETYGDHETFKRPVAPQAETSNTAVNHSVLPPPTTGARSKKHSVRFGSPLNRFWREFKKRIGPGTAPSSVEDGSLPTQRSPNQFKEGGDAKTVDDVVVDRVWTGDVKESDSTTSEDDIILDLSGASPPKKREWHGADPPDLSTLQYTWFFIRWRLWAVSLDFFYPKGYSSAEAEEHYQREDWFVSKPLAIVAALWLIVNWLIGLGVNEALNVVEKADKIFYYGVAPALSVPILFMVVFNWPRDRRAIYQVVLTCSVWVWAFYFVLFIYLCGFYDPDDKRHHTHFSCGKRDFQALFYYTTALQTIALFGLKLDRFPAAVGATAWFIFAFATIIPDRAIWARSIVSFAFFHIFLIYVHYVRENAERRLHHLRSQVKMQYRATQRAQINERKMADSKYRLTSYVFHEVRVPLNAAVIAVQNMAASGTIVSDMELEFSALSGSLQTMSQVLNDVLDFNRIDSGHFESVSKPFVFHKAMRTLFKTIEVMTVAKNLTFVVDLDPEIDRLARRASYQGMGQSDEDVENYIKNTPDVEGVVIGDEARLRQIIHNLASNATKFTEPHGKIIISTRLLTAAQGAGAAIIDVPVTDKRDRLSASNISLHNRGAIPLAPSVIVRIEVTDTGCGIERAEARKLFSPFVQTEKGRQQGGYGSGLGLSLVRSIVKLLGGRLGFSSEKNVGSTFWVELPLGVGPEDVLPDSDMSSDCGSELANTRAVARKMSPLPESARVERLAMTVNAAALQASASSNSVALPSVPSSLMERVGIGSSPEPVRRNSTPSDFSLPPSPTVKSNPSTMFASRQDSQVSRRPGQLPMPSRGFSRDPQPTTSTLSTNMSSLSESSQLQNPMALFDRTFNPRHATSSKQVVDYSLSKGLSVLLVDDDFMTRGVTRKMLERFGCEVAVAENGRVAVQMILGMGWTPTVDDNGSTYFVQSHADAAGDEEQTTPGAPAAPNSAASSNQWVVKYDLVLLDNQMPLMSGQQAIKILRSLGRKEFVVGLTGNALLPDQQEYREAGVDDVLAKPIQQDALQEVFRRADARRKRDSVRGEPP